MLQTQSYGIFTDPVFIRRNVLLNFLHSNFPSDELKIIPTNCFKDLLRANYHSLSPINDRDDRTSNVSLIFSILTQHSDNLNEIDWYYAERITLHFANFSKPFSSQVAFLLNRK